MIARRKRKFSGSYNSNFKAQSSSCIVEFSELSYINRNLHISVVFFLLSASFSVKWCPYGIYILKWSSVAMVSILFALREKENTSFSVIWAQQELSEMTWVCWMFSMPSHIQRPGRSDWRVGVMCCLGVRRAGEVIDTPTGVERQRLT